MEKAMRCRAQRVLTVLGIAWGCGLLSAQTLTVDPALALADQVVTIRAAGLDPGERVSIRAELTDGAGHHWASKAEFAADAAGGVDASTQAPVSGSYKDVSAMGLIWSMMPAERAAAHYQPPPNRA